MDSDHPVKRHLPMEPGWQPDQTLVAPLPAGDSGRRCSRTDFRTHGVCGRPRRDRPAVVQPAPRRARLPEEPSPPESEPPGPGVLPFLEADPDSRGADPGWARAVLPVLVLDPQAALSVL